MKNLKAIVFFFLFSAGVMAQDRGSVVLDVIGSYTFEDKVNFDYGSVKLGDGFMYGMGFQFFPQKNSSIEVKYLRINNTISYDVPGTISDSSGSGAVTYVLIGGNRYFDNGKNAVPFVGGSIGMGMVKTPTGYEDRNFAWELKGGVKIKTASIVSVTLQASLQSMIAESGTDVYWGYWGPVAVADYAYSYQFGLGAVIGFNFK
jgi:hypothetical protein